MTRSVALLRAVNVGGRKVAMRELCAWAEELGLREARTILQSGNLLFQGPGLEEGKLETAAAQRWGFEIGFCVRSGAEVAAVVEANPFPEFAREDPAHLAVMFLKGVPEGSAVEALRAVVRGPEQVEVRGAQLFITYPEGIGESRLTNVVIERKLGMRGTARNWKTVQKLVGLLV